MGQVYQSPKYYEIAFSFRDIRAEVDLFEELIRQYSHIPVTRMLEIGCGPATHLPELARRSYAYIGLDISLAMLSYAQDRAQSVGATAVFVEADLRQFQLGEPVDFAFILLGSLFAQNTADLTAHFDAIGQALKPGGLYLLDWCINFTTQAGSQDSWTITQDSIVVTTTYEATLVNAVEQTIEESLTLTVEESGRQTLLRDVNIKREIYPQEFLLFLAQRPDFEFVGWWNNGDITQPLDGTRPINRPITVIRKV